MKRISRAKIYQERNKRAKELGGVNVLSVHEEWELISQTQLEADEKELLALKKSHGADIKRILKEKDRVVREILAILNLDQNFVQDIMGADEFDCQTFSVTEEYIEEVAREKGGNAYYLIKLPYSVGQSLKNKHLKPITKEEK